MKKIVGNLFILFVFLTAISTFSQNNWKKVNENMSVLNTQYSGVYKAKISYDGTQIIFFTNSGYLIKINTETGLEISNTFIMSDFRDVDFTPDAEYFVYISKYNPNILRDSNKVTIMNLFKNTQKSITYYTDRGNLNENINFNDPMEKIYISDNKDLIMSKWQFMRLDVYSPSLLEYSIHSRFLDFSGKVLPFENNMTPLYDISSKKGIPGFVFSGINSSTNLIAGTQTTYINSYVFAINKNEKKLLHYSQYYHHEDNSIQTSETKVDSYHKYFYKIKRKDDSLFNCNYEDKDNNKYLGTFKSTFQVESVEGTKNQDYGIIGWNYSDDNAYTIKILDSSIFIRAVLFDKNFYTKNNEYPFPKKVNILHTFAFKNKLYLFCSDDSIRVIQSDDLAGIYYNINISSSDPRIGENIIFESIYSREFTHTYLYIESMLFTNDKIKYVFNDTGVYNIKLVCKNDIIEKTKKILLNIYPKLIADFEVVGGLKHYVGDTITILDKSKGTLYSTYFDYADANKLEGENLFLIYDKPGFRTITSKVSDKYGIRSLSKNIEIILQTDIKKDIWDS